ncbi:hypothetical protein B566_EDAN007235 [Ephemera danica]|nr:hypothetical protein B566_EDAN007235 [Ephemera danica]
MSFGVSLCLFRLEISNEYPLLDHLKYTAPKYRRTSTMASTPAGSTEEPALPTASSTDTRRGQQQGRREMRTLRVETTLMPAGVASSSSSSKEPTPQPDAASSEGEGSSSKSTSESINFVSGNPYVEVTKGILHLYKENELTSVETEALRSEQQSADEFYKTFHGAPYSSMSQDELCHVAFVSKVEVVREGDCGVPPLGHTELPTCPVCLERMDESVDGILTILCNHSFHSSCLAKWGDQTCPVCRYVQTPEAVADNRCFECHSSESLWICLICGHVGCGRYVQGHASQHFMETQHCYSMQLGNNRVWDYVGDNFVHRLLQNKEDGKMVALGAGQEGSTFEKPPGSEEKVDSLQLEFTYLLTSQLESQRQYFEEKMIRMEQELLAEGEELRETVRTLAEEKQSLAKQLEVLKREKANQDKKVQMLTTKLGAAQSELQQECSMSRGLQQNQTAWQERFTALEAKFTEYKTQKDKELSDVKEQLRDVMFYLEAQNQISRSEHRDEIAEGHIVVAEPPTPPSSAGSSKQRRRKNR